MFFTTFIFLFVDSFCQTNEFDMVKFQTNKKEKNDSILNIYKVNNKYKYLNLLPSVNYDVINKSINIGFSLSNLSNYFQNKHRNKIELLKIETQLNDNLNNKIERLELEIEILKNLTNSYKKEIEIFEIDKKLFEISEGKYMNSEISIEEYLKKKQEFLIKKNKLEVKKSTINIKKIKLHQNLNY